MTTVPRHVSPCHHLHCSHGALGAGSEGPPADGGAGALRPAGVRADDCREIARSVGLTERTFFRHFTDKREVLFDGQELLQQHFVDAVTAAPPTEAPLELVASALAATAELFTADRRDWSRQRQGVIAANPPLRERELLKMAALSAAVTEALRARGIPDPAATLAAQSGITVFEVAFLQWISDNEKRTLAEVELETFEQLRALTT